MIHVTAPHFCAGAIFSPQTGIFVRAAPILKYFIGKDVAWAHAYCKRRGWAVEYS